MPQFSDPDVEQAYQSGQAMLGQSTATAKRGLRKYMDQFRVAAPGYLGTADATMDASEAQAQQTLLARMRELQIRSQLQQQYFDNLWAHYKNQKSADKENTWATLLGSMGRIGGGVLGSLGSRGRSTPAIGASGLWGMGQSVAGLW